MKILWLCNIMPAQIAKAIHEPVPNIVGWINILMDTLNKNTGCELTVLFPVDRKKPALHGAVGRIVYYSFFYNIVKPEQYGFHQEEFFQSILEKVRPDIIHIWGSEYPHTLAMARACNEKNLRSRTILSIQGLISVYAKHYYANLPESVINGKTIRDFLRRDWIKKSKKKFEVRGMYEIEAMRQISHVTGRTDWDHACVKMINPNLVYHHGNEILRPSFYTGQSWEYQNCQRHSIFISQWEYPLKGFHMFLDAFRNIIKEFPDARLTVSGMNLFPATVKEKIKQSYYDRYLLRLIEKWELKSYITFFSRQLTETEMKEQYMRTHVFVLPSAIENSSNSLGEAMISGVPVVASNVGGTGNMLTHEKEGFLYPFDEPYMLAYYVRRIFQDRQLAERLSAAGKIRASQAYHIQNNTSFYMDLYQSLR